MKRIPLWIVFILLIACLPLSACGKSTASSSKKEVPSKLEVIKGTDIKRVILTESAAKRLDIQTVTVGNGVVDRKQVISGEVVENPLLKADSTTTAAPSTNEAWVRAGLSMGDLQKIDRKRTVAIRPVTADAQASSLAADEVEVTNPSEEGESNMTVAYYLIKNGAQDLSVGQRVGIEYAIQTSGMKRIVVPYGAIIYNQVGETWVYTNPEHLVYVRSRVIVDYIDNDQAYLVVGPPSGTKIVVVGVAELFGAETGVSK